MHEDVLKRFIDVYAIMLSPICSHWCEYVWMDVLGNTTSITKALGRNDRNGYCRHANTKICHGYD